MEEVEKPKMGRRKKLLEDITVTGWDLLDSLILHSAHSEFIAEQLSISEDTLSKRIKEEYGCTFTEYRNKKKEKVRINIKRAQYELGVKDKNPTMLIWLGKVECGQTDKVEADVSVSHSFNIQVEDYEDNQEG